MYFYIKNSKCIYPLPNSSKRFKSLNTIYNELENSKKKGKLNVILNGPYNIAI